MKKATIAVLLSLVLASAPAFAIDSTKCPQSFDAVVSKISPFKKSTFDNNAGWVAARDILAASSSDVLYEFTLKRRTPTTCSYTEVSGGVGKLMSIDRYDQEDGTTYNNDHLFIQFPVGEATFSLFPGVETYNLQGIRLFSQEGPQRTRVRTRLNHAATGGLRNYEVGLAHIKTQ